MARDRGGHEGLRGREVKERTVDLIGSQNCWHRGIWDNGLQICSSEDVNLAGAVEDDHLLVVRR